MLMLMMVAAIGEYDFSTAIGTSTIRQMASRFGIDWLGSIQYVQEFPDAQESIYDLSRLAEIVDEFLRATNLE